MDTLRQKLERNLGITIGDIQTLRGGSGDGVYLVTDIDNQKYVYKTGEFDSISTQIDFYRQYPDIKYLPKLVFSSEDLRELVITFINSGKPQDSYDKIEILTQLTNHCIAKYKQVDENFYGFKSGFIKGKSFVDFLKEQSKEAYSYVPDIFTVNDLNLVLKTTEEIYSDEIFEVKYLLHGDLGFHNLFHSKDELLGIIDPDPIIGHPLYDLMFAFCSTPEQITSKNLENCLTLLNKYHPFNINNSRNYLTIALFKRISSCKKHHPDDLSSYLKIWNDLSR